MLSRKMKILLSFLVMILILTGGASWYVLKVKPLQKQMATLETSIKSEQEQIGKYEKGDVKKSGEVKDTDTVNLQKQIPVVEGEDQFIVMLEKAEVASGSQIRNISLTNTADTSKDQSTNTKAKNNSMGQISQTVNPGSSQTNANQVEPGTPAGLEKLTATLTVEANNYFELEAFVKAIESFERITNVVQMQFSGTAEVTKAGDVLNKTVALSYTLTVSTYYFPTLTALKNQAPKYDPSLPAEKKNPLYQDETFEINPSPSKIDNTENYKVVEQKGLTYHVYSYDVKPGDTLFQLSVKYYNSLKGEELIKSWNGINQIRSGTTIEIPVPIDSEK